VAVAAQLWLRTRHQLPLCPAAAHNLLCSTLARPGAWRELTRENDESHEIIRWNGDEWGIRIRRILSSDTVERCWKRVSRPGVLAPVPDHASSNATKEGKTEKSKQNLKNAAKDLGKWRMQVHHTGLWVLPVQKPVVMSQVTSIELLILLQRFLSSLTCARQVHCVSFRSHPALQLRQLCQDNTPMSVNNYRNVWTIHRIKEAKRALNKTHDKWKSISDMSGKLKSASLTAVFSS